MADETTTGRSARLAGAAVITVSAVAWWPAFTLGAWGAVFFEQILALWAASTAAFIIAVSRARLYGRRRGTAVLLVPTLWLVLSMLDAGRFEDRLSDALTVLGAAMTVLGIPFLAMVLIRIAVPAVSSEISSRDRWLMAVAACVVVLLAFALGRANDRFLTCEDFRISGNSQPPGCKPEGLPPEPGSAGGGTRMVPGSP